MLQPKRVKFRKHHRGRRKGVATSGATLVFGDYGLQTLQGVWITSRQIEAARRVITRYLRKGGNMWIRVFPDKPVTKKPAETRQGGGKGPPDHWVAVAKRGRILFEVAGIRAESAREALERASDKLPFPTKFVAKEEPAAMALSAGSEQP